MFLILYCVITKGRYPYYIYVVILPEYGLLSNADTNEKLKLYRVSGIPE